MISSLIFADKIPNERGKNKVLYFICSFLFLSFSLLAYSPSLTTLAVVFLGKLIIEFIDSGRFKEFCKKAFFSHIWVLYVALASAFVYVITLKILYYNGIYDPNAYNTKFVEIADLPQKILDTLSISFALLTTTFPFITEKYKLVLMGIILVAIVSVARLMFKKPLLNLYKFVIFMGMGILTLFLTQLAGLLASSDSAFGIRLQFFGITYFYALCVALIMKYGNIVIKNIGNLLIVIAIFISSVNDIQAQKIWKLAFDNEMRLYYSVINRITYNENYSSKKDYTYLQVGVFQGFSQQYYPDKYDQASGEMLNFRYQLKGKPMFVFNFLYPEFFHYEYIKIGQLIEKYDKKMDRELSDFILNKAEAWPQRNSVYVSDNYILVVANQRELNRLKAKIRRNRNRRN